MAMELERPGHGLDWLQGFAWLEELYTKAVTVPAKGGAAGRGRKPGLEGWETPLSVR